MKLSLERWIVPGVCLGAAWVLFSERPSAFAQGTSDSGLMARIQHLESQQTPSGTIVAFGGKDLPAGWLRCDGGRLKITDHPRLFSAIGTSWGDPDGPENVEFNLPDLAGMFLRGVTTDKKRDPDSSKRTSSQDGGNTGAAVGSYQPDAFAAHNHMQRVLARPGASGPKQVRISYVVDAPGIPYDQDTAYTHDSGGSETRPKNVFVHYIIKL